MPLPNGGRAPLPSPGLFPSDVGPFTDQLEASLAPWQDSEGAWYAYIAALGSMFEQVFQLVADFGDPDDPENYTPGWSILLDPDNCPDQYLSYAGQFVGLFIAPGTDPATARQMLRDEQGFQRGTPAIIIAAAQRHLSGSQSCVLLERTPTPYAFQLVVRPSEDVDEAGLRAAVDAVRPAGITWDLIKTNGWVLFQMEAAYGSLTALESAFHTINGVENDQVGH